MATLQEFRVVEFKYRLVPCVPFNIMDLRSKKRGRPSVVNIPKTYSGPAPICQKKKDDLLSLIPLINSEWHHFYQSLPTNQSASDNIVPDSDSSSEEEK